MHERTVIGPCTLYLGDCRDVMDHLAGDGTVVASCVTDPPYELGFMGKAWDAAGGVASDPDTWRRVHALLSPGGHCVAFAGSRTYHRIASAIEASGFEIRDQLMWLYGSGFPKSHDISKCIDKRGGVWRGRAGQPLPDDRKEVILRGYARTTKGEAVFDDARAWEGWGTALKPAHEPIALARKRFSGTVTDNVLRHGTGAVNVDACRVGSEDLGTRNVKASDKRGAALSGSADGSLRKAWTYDGSKSRWPANVITDGSLEVLEAFPAAAREAIRFFYAPKADRSERESGLRDSPINVHANIHPTVKPIDLMAWLCRLVTPPGGVVLEPFMGSGSTGIAAVRHGFGFVGIEQSPEYFEIARRRIQAAVDAEASAPSFEAEITRAVRAVQLGLFEQQHMASVGDTIRTA